MKNEKIKLANIPAPVTTLYNCKVYAVTPTINEEDSYTYTITHKKSGLKVVSLSDKTKAIKLCCELNRKLPEPFIYKDAAKRFVIDFMDANNVSFFHLRTYNC